MDSKPCKCGEISLSYSVYCKSCSSDVNRCARIGRLDYMREYAKSYRERNAERLKAYYLKWCESQKEKMTAKRYKRKKVVEIYPQ